MRRLTGTTIAVVTEAEFISHKLIDSFCGFSM
jgi:hypothetical protein